MHLVPKTTPRTVDQWRSGLGPAFGDSQNANTHARMRRTSVTGGSASSLTCTRPCSPGHSSTKQPNAAIPATGRCLEERVHTVSSQCFAVLMCRSRAVSNTPAIGRRPWGSGVGWGRVGVGGCTPGEQRERACNGVAWERVSVASAGRCRVRPGAGCRRVHGRMNRGGWDPACSLWSDQHVAWHLGVAYLAPGPTQCRPFLASRPHPQPVTNPTPGKAHLKILPGSGSEASSSIISRALCAAASLGAHTSTCRRGR